jgi:glyoxylase I family protein
MTPGRGSAYEYNREVSVHDLEGHVLERVTGIGGVFFKARDPEGLAQWYAKCLGVEQPPNSYEDASWWQEAGPTVFTAMAADSEHFERPEQTWAVNFRVPNLDAMVEQLRALGVAVDVDTENYPNGRFASTHDPEGNPVQLWEPDGPDRLGGLPS